MNTLSLSLSPLSPRLRVRVYSALISLSIYQWKVPSTTIILS